MLLIDNTRVQEHKCNNWSVYRKEILVYIYIIATCIGKNKNVVVINARLKKNKRHCLPSPYYREQWMNCTYKLVFISMKNWLNRIDIHICKHKTHTEMNECAWSMCDENINWMSFLYGKNSRRKWYKSWETHVLIEQ